MGVPLHAPGSGSAPHPPGPPPSRSPQGGARSRPRPPRGARPRPGPYRASDPRSGGGGSGGLSELAGAGGDGAASKAERIRRRPRRLAERAPRRRGRARAGPARGGAAGGAGTQGRRSTIIRPVDPTPKQVDAAIPPPLSAKDEARPEDRSRTRQDPTQLRSGGCDVSAVAIRRHRGSREQTPVRIRGHRSEPSPPLAGSSPARLSLHVGLPGARLGSWGVTFTSGVLPSSLRNPDVCRSPLQGRLFPGALSRRSRCWDRPTPSLSRALRP
ncbi:translation initiation factor IF-2-like [Choloepus didactylus]|uniref:translation initiation factor IF-2-like n=1 Tax=Choloepus didactylus TaxID=27675 RepID=UPI0018A12537|nr:translation initiation factor IF-2-like [Choloepus didactylus]